MFKNHLEIAKLFRYDSASDTYFYHLKEKWIAGDEVITVNEWVSVTKEVYDDLRRGLWNEYKQQDRSSRCRNEDGTRCMEKCKNCPRGKTSRDGLPLSLEQMMEVGALLEDEFCVEANVEKQDLLDALHEAISNLEEKDRLIATLYAQGLSQRAIAKVVDMSQKGIGYREKVIFPKLKQELKNFL